MYDLHGSTKLGAHLSNSSRTHLGRFAAAVLAVLVLIPFAVFAIPPRYNPRPNSAAMGHANLTGTQGFEVPYYNPASVASFDDGLGVEAALDFSFTPDIIDLYYDIDHFMKVDRDNSTEALKQETFESLLSDYGTRSFLAQTDLDLSLKAHGFFFALNHTLKSRTRMTTNSYTEGTVAVIDPTELSISPALATGTKLLNKSVSVGVLGKMIFTQTLFKEDRLTTQSFINGRGEGNSTMKRLIGDYDRRGLGLGADIGATADVRQLFSDPETQSPSTSASFLAALKPKLGVAVQNIGNTRFMGGPQAPNDYPMEMSLGIGLFPAVGHLENEFHIALRGTDFEQDLFTMLHIGVASTYKKLFTLRVGLNQSYPCGGLDLLFPHFLVSIFTYAEEVGRYAQLTSVRSYGLLMAVH